MFRGKYQDAISDLRSLVGIWKEIEYEIEKNIINKIRKIKGDDKQSKNINIERTLLPYEKNGIFWSSSAILKYIY